MNIRVFWHSCNGSRSQPREACVLRILSLGIVHLEHLHLAGPVLVLKAIVVLPAHESEWLLRVESVRCAALTPDAHAQRPRCEHREHPARWRAVLGSASLDHNIRLQQQQLREGQPEPFRRLQVHGEFEFRRLFDGQESRLRSAENPIYEDCAARGAGRCPRLVASSRSCACRFA